jgi:hypothetical protein
MTTYPHRYGDTDRAVEHYATACVASAKILRSEGLPDQAADLQAEAERARAQIHPDHPTTPTSRADRSTGPPRPRRPRPVRPRPVRR